MPMTAAPTLFDSAPDAAVPIPLAVPAVPPFFPTANATPVVLAQRTTTADAKIPVAKTATATATATAKTTTATSAAGAQNNKVAEVRESRGLVSLGAFLCFAFGVGWVWVGLCLLSVRY
jgi:hypothetical protein